MANIDTGIGGGVSSGFIGGGIGSGCIGGGGGSRVHTGSFHKYHDDGLQQAVFI